MKLHSRFTAIFDSTLGVLAFVAALALIAIMLLVGADVTMRYLFNKPIDHVKEITEHLLLAMTFLGAAWVLKKEGHVKIDLLLNRINQEAQALINAIASSLGTVICLALTWYSAQVTWDVFQRGVFFPTLLRLPQAPFMAIIFIGCFLLFIQFLRRSCKFLSEWKSLQSQEQKA